MVLMGKKYDLVNLTEADIRKDVLVRFMYGKTARRIICEDGEEVVLRGITSGDVFDVVGRDRLIDEWLRLVPAEG